MAVGGHCHTLSALPLVKSHGAHCRGGRVGPWASLDRHGEQKISCLHQGSKTGPSSLLQVIILTTVKNSNVFLDVTWCNLMTSKYLNEHVFSVFTVEQLKALIPVLWDVMLHWQVFGSHCFKGMCHFSCQGFQYFCLMLVTTYTAMQCHILYNQNPWSYCCEKFKTHTTLT
jgi:hypothetical protein